MKTRDTNPGLNQRSIHVLSQAQRAAPAFASSGRGFTLIELLVVIAIIALLAGMIFPVMGIVNRIKIRSKARAELQDVVMAINSYKDKLGHYPPDNPLNHALNPLYFELLGTTLKGTTFTTLDGTGQIDQGQVSTVFGAGLTGFINCTQGAGDEGRPAMPFLRNLKPGQSGTNPAPVAVRILTCSVPWPDTTTSRIPGTTLIPICYNSSSPTNNPNSYELWLDVVISGKTNRICNWSRDPIIVGSPL